MEGGKPGAESTTAQQFPGLAAAAKARPEEVSRQTAAIRASVVVQALLEWLDGFVVVLNDRRQILAANASFLRELGVEQEGEVLGQRLGEALGCVYPAAGTEGCGTANGCRQCGLLQAIVQTGEERVLSEEEYRLTTPSGSSDRTRKFRVRVAPIIIGGQTYTVLLLQRPTTQPRATDTLDGIADESEWPEGLKRFTRLRPLGSGGMGTVHLVADEHGRPFALKLVHVPERASPRHIDSIRQRFQLETEVGLNLNHPNIVRVFESGSASARIFYLVSEFCPHGSTSVLLQRLGIFPIDAALHWMIDAARGLAYAWKEHRIVHRDVKPDNLLIGEGFRLKIADFGIARRKAENVLALTTPGMVIGSARYMAPEQAYAPNDVDNRSDLYSLGATFYHLLCGVPPFTGANSVQIMMHHAKTPLVPLCLRRPQLPAEVGNVVDGLLAKHREDRPLDASQVVSRLEELVRGLGLDPDVLPESATLAERAVAGETRRSWGPDVPGPGLPGEGPSSSPTTRELRGRRGT